MFYNYPDPCLRHLILLDRRPAAGGADSFPCRRRVPLATVLGAGSAVASALEPVSALVLASQSALASAWTLASVSASVPRKDCWGS